MAIFRNIIGMWKKKIPKFPKTPHILFRMMKYKLYLVDYYENLQVEQVEADTETDALLLLALAARLNEFEPVGVELLAA